MVVIKLDYFTLLSPEPFRIPNVGSVICPTLRQIGKVGYGAYLLYMDCLLTNIVSYYENIQKDDNKYLHDLKQEERDIILDVQKEYDNLSNEEKSKLSFFNIFIYDKRFLAKVLNTLNFFILEKIIYSDEHKGFVVYNQSKDDIANNDKIIGFISQHNYEIVVSIIMQRLGISDSAKQTVPKYKNKATLKIWEKLNKQPDKKKPKVDKKVELANIISSLATHSKSLNMTNIWDLTVYQLNDQFARQQLEDSYSINASHVSTWGAKDNKFNGSLWLSLIEK